MHVTAYNMPFASVFSIVCRLPLQLHATRSEGNLSLQLHAGKDDDSAQLLTRLDLTVARAGGDLSVGQCACCPQSLHDAIRDHG